MSPNGMAMATLMIVAGVVFVIRHATSPSLTHLGSDTMSGSRSFCSCLIWLTIASLAVAAEMSKGCEGMAHHAPDKQKPDRRSSCAVA
jgi:hypothetical protein